MKKQQGFSLTNLVLAMTVAGVFLATILPPLLNTYRDQQERLHISNAIALTLSRLHDTVSQQIEECPATHTVTVNSLDLPPETLLALPSLTVAVGTTGKMIKNVSLDFILPTQTKATFLQSALTTEDKWITRKGTHLTITQPFWLLDSTLKRLNYNATTGCYEK